MEPGIISALEYLARELYHKVVHEGGARDAVGRRYLWQSRANFARCATSVFVAVLTTNGGVLQANKKRENEHFSKTAFHKAAFAQAAESAS